MSLPDVAGRRGITMVEVVVTMTIMAIIVVAVVPFFQVSMSGYSEMESRTSIGGANQKALNRVQARLSECKRIFENDAFGTDLLTRVGGGPTQLPDNALPTIVDAAGLTPGTTTHLNTGNVLFFAGSDAPHDLTVPGGVVTVDTYRFHLYAPSTRTGSKKAMDGKSIATLWEWHSLPYADSAQLLVLPASSQTIVAAALYSQGVKYAWDPSTSTMSGGFFKLTSGGTINADPSPTLQPETVKNEFKTQDMMYLLSGSMSGGFTYGLATDNQSAPKFASAGAGRFPAGFEVFIAGASSARQVVLHSTMAAKGSYKGFVLNDQILVVTARDVW